MALDRIGPTLRPLGVPDRQPAQPGPAARAPAQAPVDPEFPLAPPPPLLPSGAAPVGAIPDAQEAHVLPPGGLEALADALADVPSATDPAAMRPNQVFLSRQLVWQPPDTAMMAASWQVMVRTYSEQRAAWLEQTTGQHIPASLFLSDQIPAGSRDGRPGLPMLTEMEPWRFAVYAWGDRRLVLRVVVIDDDEYERQRRKRARAALRLELTLPEVGRVVIQLEPSSGAGVVMEVGAAQTSAMQHMREILPQLAATVGRLGLTILRCRLRRELPPSSGEHPYPSRMQTAGLTPAIFHAMAAVATLLSQPAIPDEVQ
ncbi:hypothetical protein GJ698_00100 [Pseudoduganella sp. FT26W]|uniref:Flagellar hook-length control protein FliK n=1 Tax=Duganella aquatilis TaxID=2666082 RepID=A0A844CUN8_9BURK|nr:hypothetical protein [Duganella aquatilis]MRW82491.1 hypothetical protein [Duganella aquatilis]